MGQQMKKNGLLLVAAAITVSALMSACVMAPVDPYYDQPVRLPPPPPRHEYLGYAPAPDYVWISGYWGWGGARYEWIPGRWEAPRPGYQWMPHRWERSGDHWRQSGGRWEQDNRPRTMPAPVVVPQNAPRSERDYPQYREQGGDARNFRDQRPVAPVERGSQPRYEQREAGRSAPVNPAPRPDRDSYSRPAAPVAAPAPAPAVAPQPSAVRRDESARGRDGGDRGDGRSKRRRGEDER